MEKKIKLVCDQLIDEKDLIISDEVIEELKVRDLTLKVCDKSVCEVKIYSKVRFPISDIIPILGDFGFITISEITYEAKFQKDILFVTKLLLDIEKKELLIKHKENFKSLFLNVIDGNLESGKLLGLVYFENFSLREIFYHAQWVTMQSRLSLILIKLL
ncbi:MAG: NAD-glutamate dehydrogenase [Epsilonproteobacteria bacterium]|nr:NAD-glutamate dehydrogenase [Campylobacterota bacterium]